MTNIKSQIVQIMSKSISYQIVSFLFLVIVSVSACEPKETPGKTITSTPIVNVATSVTPNVLATATKIAVSNEIPGQPYSDEVLISIGGIKTDNCLPENRAEIWISDYPYETISPLLQDPNIDYLYPNWSPNGEWFAYVASNPLEVKDPTIIPQETGTDSIWIMHPDGSEQQQLSEIPSLIIRSGLNNSCFVQSGIALPLTWSPEGKYIIFAAATWDNNNSKLMYNYYYLNIETGTSQFLLSQDLGSSPVWTSNNVVAISGKGVVNLVRGFETNNVTLTTVSYPTQIPIESMSFISTFENDKSLAVSFRLGSTLISPVPKEISIWDLDPIAEEWKHLTTIEKQTWGIPKFGSSSVTLCEENSISLLNPNSWEFVDQLTSKELSAEWINCGALKLIRQDPNIDLLLLAVSENELKIEAITLQTEIPEVKTLITPVAFSHLPEGTIILDFSLRSDT